MNIDTRGGIGGNGGNCVNGGDGQHGRKEVMQQLVVVVKIEAKGIIEEMGGDGGN